MRSFSENQGKEKSHMPKKNLKFLTGITSTQGQESIFSGETSNNKDYSQFLNQGFSKVSTKASMGKIKGLRKKGGFDDSKELHNPISSTSKTERGLGAEILSQEKSLVIPMGNGIEVSNKTRQFTQSSHLLSGEGGFGQSPVGGDRGSFWMNKNAGPHGRYPGKTGKGFYKTNSSKNLNNHYQTQASLFSQINRKLNTNPRATEEEEEVKDQREDEQFWEGEQIELNEVERSDVMNLENWLAVKKNEAVLSENYIETKNNQVSTALIERYLHPVDPEIDISFVNSIMNPPPNGKSLKKMKTRGSAAKIMSLQVVEHIKDYNKYLKDLAGPAGTLVGKSSQPQKTPDAVRYDLNKFILNDIVGRKLKTELEQGGLANSGGLASLMGIQENRGWKTKSSFKTTTSFVKDRSRDNPQEPSKIKVENHEGLIQKTSSSLNRGKFQPAITDSDTILVKKKPNFSENRKSIEEAPKKMSELAQRIAIAKPAQRIAAETMGEFKCFQHLQAGQKKGFGDDLSMDYLLWVVKHRTGSDLEEELKFSEHYKMYLNKKSKDSSSQMSLKSLENHLRSQLEENIAETEKKIGEIVNLQKEKNKKSMLLKKQRIIVDSEVNKLKEEQQSIEDPMRSDTLRLERRGGVRESMANYMRVTEIMQQKILLEEKMKEITSKTMSEINQCSSSIRIFEKDLESLKNTRRYLKIKLKELYFRVLENEEESISIGKPYFRIIQALWELKEAPVRKQFTKILDGESVTFLTEYAKMDLELQKISKGVQINQGFQKMLSSSETKRGRLVHDQTLPSFLEASKMLPKESFAALPMSKQLSILDMRLREIKKREVKQEKRVLIKKNLTREIKEEWVPVEHRTEPLKTFLLAEEIPDGDRQVEELKHNANLFHIKNKGQKSIVEVSKKMEEMQTNEINRVVKNFWKMPNDKETITRMMRVITILSNDGRASFEVQRFLKERRIVISPNSDINENKDRPKVSKS